MTEGSKREDTKARRKIGKGFNHCLALMAGEEDGGFNRDSPRPTDYWLAPIVTELVAAGSLSPAALLAVTSKV
jgi:hypothetical protein